VIFYHKRENKNVYEYFRKVYSFSEVYLVLLNQTKTAKTAASDYYLPMLVIVTSFFLPESPRIGLDPGAFRLYWVYPT